MKNKDGVGGKVKEITIFFALIVQFIRCTQKCNTALQHCKFAYMMPVIVMFCF